MPSSMFQAAVGAAGHHPLLDWSMAVCVALPHFLYAFIWFFPNTWRQTFSKKPVEAFETLAWVLKLVQFSSVGAWYVLTTPGSVFQPGVVKIWQWLVSAALLAGGQALNIGIYKAIGHPGVYYGFKLGHHIPWFNGFPFNVVAHPQYVGSAMTVWGAVLLMLGQGNPAMLTLGAYWTGLYLVTALQEQFL